MYCLRCKAHHDGIGAQEITMKNSRKALKGTCPRCGASCFQILKKDKAPTPPTPPTPSST